MRDIPYHTMATLILLITLYPAAAAGPEKILLTDVKVLTLRAGHKTTGRLPVPQLQCLGDLCKHAPDTVQCTNVGTDGINVQWKCETEMHETLSIKAHDVNCEGYDSPTDPYILVGSCGLSYHIEGTPPSEPNSTIDNISVMIWAGIIGLACLCTPCYHRRRYGNHRRPYDNHYRRRPGFFSGMAAGGAMSAAYHRRGTARPARMRTSSGFCGTIKR